jgi:hypothetical protein
MEEQKQGWFQRLTSGLSRSTREMTEQVTSVLVKKPLDQAQLDALEEMLIEADLGPHAAARITGLPLIIHARAADEDMARILSEEYRNGPYRCVMHCFSSGAALAQAALDLGFYLSMSGIAAFPRSDDLRAIFRAAGPAVLFTKPRGSDFPILCNLYGTQPRIERIFADTLDRVASREAQRENSGKNSQQGGGRFHGNYPFNNFEGPIALELNSNM